MYLYNNICTPIYHKAMYGLYMRVIRLNAALRHCHIRSAVRSGLWGYLQVVTGMSVVVEHYPPPPSLAKVHVVAT